MWMGYEKYRTTVRYYEDVYAQTVSMYDGMIV